MSKPRIQRPAFNRWKSIIRRLDADGLDALDIGIDAVVSVEATAFDSAWLSDVAMRAPRLLDRVAESCANRRAAQVTT